MIFFQTVILSLLFTNNVIAFQTGPSFLKSNPSFQKKQINIHSFGNNPIVPIQSRQPSTILNEASPLFSFFGTIFNKPEEMKEPDTPKIPDLIVDPDYKLAIAFGFVGALFTFIPFIGTVLGGFILFLAAIFALQAGRIRFVFDETAFELKKVNNEGEDELRDSGENVVVGGANRWNYDTFVNWDFFPSVDYPILVYFKETQTPSDKWNDGPGSFDEVGGGQIHFFPAIANVKQLENQFEIRGCAKIRDD